MGLEEANPRHRGRQPQIGLEDSSKPNGTTFRSRQWRQKYLPSGFEGTPARHIACQVLNCPLDETHVYIPCSYATNKAPVRTRLLTFLKPLANLRAYSWSSYSRMPRSNTVHGWVHRPSRPLYDRLSRGARIGITPDLAGTSTSTADIGQGVVSQSLSVTL